MYPPYEGGPIVAPTIYFGTADGSHDVYEQVWGWSQFAGLVVGLVALGVAAASVWYAKRASDSAENSAQAGERTAKAAEDTAATAREELEMLKAAANRHPVLEIRSLDFHPLPGAPVRLSYS
jgi:hypothetical protein